MRFSRKNSTVAVLGLLALAAVALYGTAPRSVEAQPEVPTAAGPEPSAGAPEGGVWSYAVKFVCGFQNRNIGIGLAGEEGGEPTVKLGNYATDINIFNPSLDTTIEYFVNKKVIVLVDKGFPVGREPFPQGPRAFDGVGLGGCQAVMDDCNRIYELLGMPAPPPPAPLMVGFLVIQSPVELDVTAVYTAEVCGDWVTVGNQLMCQDNNGLRDFGAGISIDVEQIAGRYVTF